MLVFELTMPHRGSWNGKWSQEDRHHYIIKDERYLRDKSIIPKILEQKYFTYRWNDGWEACIEVSKVLAPEANKLRKKSDEFCGYDWMVESILKEGRIRVPNR